MHQIYTRNKIDYSGQVIPKAWDKKRSALSVMSLLKLSECRISVFNTLTVMSEIFYPQSLRSEIDEINEFVYHNINNGVYRAGFVTTQDAYRSFPLRSVCRFR